MCGWTVSDMQLVLEGHAFEAWFQQGASTSQQAAAVAEDPLWQLHQQLAEACMAAELPRLEAPASLKPGGLQEAHQLEERVSVGFMVVDVMHSCVLYL